ncbi:MAG: DEAD/DEAH box helicase [Enterococcus sp.]
MKMKQLPASWQEKWQQVGFNQPTQIQIEAFEPLSAGKNVVGISPTGSGKTIAYLLPLLLTIEKNQGNQLLVLTSSQELAMQVTKVAQEWGQLLDLKVQSLIGGANVSRQIEKLKQKPEVLVGTPGRVLELIKQRKVKSHLLKTVVLDEVDQLLQPGTIELVQEVLKNVSNQAQYAFFSATADASLQEITKVREDLVEIDVTATDASKGEIQHYFLRVPQRKKVDLLRKLAYIEAFRGLIFFNQLQELGSAEEKLQYHGIMATSLASDQSKRYRQLALDGFRQGRFSELLTTDVAARGLDITGLTYVVNMDVPMTKESYLHRSGRVGRMGNDGVVITLVQDDQVRDLKRLTKDIALVKEIYLHGSQFVTEKPVVEKVAPIKMSKPKVSSGDLTKTSGERVHNQEANRRPKKNRKKNTKDKGKRRK